MPSCASICTLANLHNPFAGNKKPRNGEFRGVSLNGLEFTACMRQAIEIPLFSNNRSFSGKVPVRILTRLGPGLIQLGNASGRRSPGGRGKTNYPL